MNREMVLTGGYAWASPAFFQTCVLAAFACVAVGAVAVAHLLKSAMELAKTTLCVAELHPWTVTAWPETPLRVNVMSVPERLDVIWDAARSLKRIVMVPPVALTTSFPHEPVP